MKALKLSELPVEDSLWLDFKGTFQPQSTMKQLLEPFLLALEQHALEWLPDIVRGRRQRQFSRAAFWKALEEKLDENCTDAWLHRTQWPALDMSVELYLPPFKPRLDILIEMKPLSFLSETRRCQEFVEMVRDWASCHEVSYASAHSLADRGLAGSPYFGRSPEDTHRDGFDQIYEVCWLNVFGPKLVQAVGRERMLSTPAHRVEALPHGGVLLVTVPIAADYASDEARVAQARAHVHLRPDLDFDTVLRTLRQRSATLAPVPPRFHPDVAPLLSRVVDSVPLHERPPRIAELNAWRPPEPSEWRPAGALLPSDVGDPERALAHYGQLAERLVALLHTRVPSVFKTTPESLTDVDYQLWHEEFPRVFERELLDAQAVPALGAYLGEVLVRHLGGQWIARQKLEEAQVLVGERVWLPFVRAHHALRSCQSLLDSSLTQLFRVAARHRR